MHKLRVFLDFDGTISTRDVVDGVLETFARKEWLEVEKSWREGRIGSRECLARQIDFVVAKEKSLMEFIDQVEVDPYFIEFLERAAGRRIPVAVVSDGFDLFIEAILKKHLQHHPELLKNLPVFCNRLYWTGLGLKAIFAGTPCAHGCANCKVAVIQKQSRPGEKIIFVGDGWSDRFAAQTADLTFAKGTLLDFCVKSGIQHQAYSNFKDVTHWVQTIGVEAVNEIH